MQLLPRPQAPLITSFSGGNETSNRLGVGNKSVGNKNFVYASFVEEEEEEEEITGTNFQWRTNETNFNKFLFFPLIKLI